MSVFPPVYDLTLSRGMYQDDSPSEFDLFFLSILIFFIGGAQAGFFLFLPLNFSFLRVYKKNGGKEGEVNYCVEGRREKGQVD